MLKIIHVPINNVGSWYFKLTTTCAQFQGQATLLQWGTGEICQKEKYGCLKKPTFGGYTDTVCNNLINSKLNHQGCERN